MPRILVITSCTGEKAVEHPQGLTLDDFRKGPDHVRARHEALASELLPAETLYTGQQHVRLMRGVGRLREAGEEWSVDLRVLSAGYGLVRGDRLLAPYEATFNGMRIEALQEWAGVLGIREDVAAALEQPYDLALVLLGDSYLRVAGLDEDTRFGGPTLVLAGNRAAGRLPESGDLRVVTLTNQEAKRFSCGLVALKGELGARLLEQLAEGSESAGDVWKAPDILALLEDTKGGRGGGPRKTGKKGPRANPSVDRVIEIPKKWWEQRAERRLKYFIPEWDDLVDPDYDFEWDTHSGGSGDWSNETYAHQMYPSPNYDGILISKVVAEKSKKKAERINQMGVHRFLRVPGAFPIMGDCGAFGYIKEESPPYSTQEILDYYTRLGFDFGVSVDHLIVNSTADSKQHRYDLTLQNAEDFLREHQAQGLPWTPIGAVQGWDAPSYAEGARRVAVMGYDYIGLGGLVRTPTVGILEVLRRVRAAIPARVKIHLFGLARIAAMRQFAELGVASVDSASLLRRAWMGTGQNYLSMDAVFYTAIRIPEAGKSFRAKRMVSEGRAGGDRVLALEQASLRALRAYDRGQAAVEDVLDAVEDLDHLITPNRPPTRELLRHTLEAMPWKSCPCEICRKDGVEVILFRGNNRNRRRGFHNTYVFYRLLQRALEGEGIMFRRAEAMAAGQLGLFGDEDGGDEV